ncbi:MAG: DNA cytosine methyltransferase [Dehalococcoidales bacterium]|nr:DNA cytosine methyltransferase [Dehalococcoidales bacterium]
MINIENASIPAEPLKVIDLFSGAGGMSLGFASLPQYFKIIAAVDCEVGKPGAKRGSPKRIHCNLTYERNIGIKPINEDISQLDPTDFMEICKIVAREVTVLISCAPCTGFSQKNAKNHLDDDPRNFLVERSALFVKKLQPEFFVMENVKELIKGKMSHHYHNLMKILFDLGYSISSGVADFADYGLPQHRIRAIIIARRENTELPAFPNPRIFPPTTVRHAIGHMPPLDAGSVDPRDPMHVCPGHNPRSMERIKAVPRNGGSWADISKDKRHLLIPSMINSRPGSFPDIYGRMSWDKPAPTITRECGHPGNGRYLHPDQDRMLSVREMSLLQGFPKNYCFEGALSSKYNQIGDAVPPLISRIIAEYIVALKSNIPVKICKPVLQMEAKLIQRTTLIHQSNLCY